MFTFFDVIMLFMTATAFMICYVVLSQMKKKHKVEMSECKKRFFELHEQNNDFWKTFVDQSQVDKVLLQLAVTFWRLAKNQIQSQKHFSVIFGNLLDIETAKRNFWRARDGAAERGFQVLNSWSDYVPINLVK